MKLAQNVELRKKYGMAARKRVMNNFTVTKFEENIKKLIINEQEPL